MQFPVFLLNLIYIISLSLGDSVLHRDEFVDFWSTHTGFYPEISRRLFYIMDSDSDGILEEAEKTKAYTTADSNGESHYYQSFVSPQCSML